MLEIAAGKDFDLFVPRPGEPTEVVRGQARLLGWWRETAEAVRKERVPVLD
jgi:hypothetical protein